MTLWSQLLHVTVTVTVTQLCGHNIEYPRIIISYNMFNIY